MYTCRHFEKLLDLFEEERLSGLRTPALSGCEGTDALEDITVADGPSDGPQSQSKSSAELLAGRGRRRNNSASGSRAKMFFQEEPYVCTNPSEEPIHVINIAVRDLDPKDDHEIYSRHYQHFCLKHADLLEERRIRRVTIMIISPHRYPLYFTWRGREHYATEDRIYRHLEPALAFQLEINRLANYVLETVPLPNQRIKLYLGTARKPPPASAGAGGDQSKTSKGTTARPTRDETPDLRFFVRMIIRQTESASNIEREGEKGLLDALDALEIAFEENDKASKTDGNHLFLNFVPTVTIDPPALESTIRRLVLRYASRLMRLRVNQAELRFNLRPQPHAAHMPMRVHLTNECGFLLEIFLYKELFDAKLGSVVFHSIYAEQKGAGVEAGTAAARHRLGPLHGVRLNEPYPTKGPVDRKRALAQSFGTTFCYDFPDMFREALRRIWARFSEQVLHHNLNRNSTGQAIPTLALLHMSLLHDVTYPPKMLVVWSICAICTDCRYKPASRTFARCTGSRSTAPIWRQGPAARTPASRAPSTRSTCSRPTVAAASRLRRRCSSVSSSCVTHLLDCSTGFL